MLGRSVRWIRGKALRTKCAVSSNRIRGTGPRNRNKWPFKQKELGISEREVEGVVFGRSDNRHLSKAPLQSDSTTIQQPTSDLSQGTLYLCLVRI